MASLVERNKESDVVIHTPNGVDFTFTKGTMKLIEGEDSYDFGTTLITDIKDSGVSGVAADEFAFRINFNYSGVLPGKAKISISLGADSKWTGKTLYYFLAESGKPVKQIDKNMVDKNGVYTVEQDHCSDYVATSKDVMAKENVQKTANQIPATQKTVKQISATPKTGDSSLAFLFLAVAIVSGGAALCIWRAKGKAR